MNPIYFFSFILLTFITFVGMVAPFPFNLLPLIFVFIGIPLLDFIIGEDKKNPNETQEQNWKKFSIWGPAVYYYVITHFAILVLGIVQSRGASISDTIILSIIVGLYTGGLGITVGHELCHKKEKIHRFFADLLLASVCYQHFAIEHVRGHHLEVSTPNDPASSRRNENVYTFLIRTITGSFIHALKIDSKGVFKGIFISILFSIGIFIFGGIQALCFFLLQSFVAIILLELVNYVEHYGLTRKQLPNGRFEKVLPIHSWNSSHKFSNSLLFNLQRHSDHHALAHLPYTVLKNQDSAPQLPSGYPGMIMLSLLPPLWFKHMNQRLDQVNLSKQDP